MQKTPRFSITAAKHSHVGFLSAFGRQAFIDSYRCTLPLNELQAYTAQAFSSETINDELNSASIIYFICQHQTGHPCGYAKLVDSEPPRCIDSAACIELQRLYVDTGYQGLGVGRLLMAHCETDARKRGLDTIWLRVWDGNLAAIAIYRKWGFSVVGDAPYPVGAEQRTVLIMSRSLTDQG